jgi:hypothetical protein
VVRKSVEHPPSSNTKSTPSGKKLSRPVQPLTAERLVLVIFAAVAALFVGIAIGIGLVLLFTSPRISRPGYRSIQQGMSRQAVENLLGPPGDFTTGPTESESMPTETELWTPDALGPPHAGRWESDEATIYVAFDDAGRVIGKSYFRERPAKYRSGIPSPWWDDVSRELSRWWRRLRGRWFF